MQAYSPIRTEANDGAGLTSGVCRQPNAEPSPTPPALAGTPLATALAQLLPFLMQTPNVPAPQGPSLQSLMNSFAQSLEQQAPPAPAQAVPRPARRSQPRDNQENYMRADTRRRLQEDFDSQGTVSKPGSRGGDESQDEGEGSDAESRAGAEASETSSSDNQQERKICKKGRSITTVVKNQREYQYNRCIRRTSAMVEVNREKPIRKPKALVKFCSDVKAKFVSFFHHRGKHYIVATVRNALSERTWKKMMKKHLGKYAVSVFFAVDRQITSVITLRYKVPPKELNKNASRLMVSLRPLPPSCFVGTI